MSWQNSNAFANLVLDRADPLLDISCPIDIWKLTQDWEKGLSKLGTTLLRISGGWHVIEVKVQDICTPHGCSNNSANNHDC